MLSILAWMSEMREELIILIYLHFHTISIKKIARNMDKEMLDKDTKTHLVIKIALQDKAIIIVRTIKYKDNNLV